jgi:hypothetical protein
MTGILLDENNDLQIKPIRENGLITSGLVIDNNDYQCVKLVIEAQKGEFKEAPTVGFGIENYLKSPIDIKQKFANELTKELKSVGFKNPKVIVGKTLLNFEVNV